MKTEMKSFVSGILLCLMAATAVAADTNSSAIIPWPQKVTMEAGVFKLTPGTRLYVDFASRETGKFLAARLRPSTGYPFKTRIQFFSGRAIKGGILATTKDANPNLGPEGYSLTVTPESVVIRAQTQAGLLYGVQTLFQLLPAEIYSTNVVTNESWQMPCVQIDDWPRFKWRGLMLDVSRHFFTKTEVEKVLDQMVLYKLNMFHWHLTDDEGWRVQIKKYPRLTQADASHKSIGSGLNPSMSTADGPDERYGGYYSQNDIREVVAYAARRHITIVPEIEMPGHSGAALAAYPELGHSGKPYAMDQSVPYHPRVYNPANPQTFTFLENVLSEVFKLFPGQYVHIGGDEVPAGVWAKDPACQALMKQNGLTNEVELQSWFAQRIAKFIVAHGKTPIGWGEIMKGGLAANAAVMDCIGGDKEAAEAGHDVVMTPTNYCYFDYYQSTNRAAEPKAAP